MEGFNMKFIPTNQIASLLVLLNSYSQKISDNFHRFTIHTLALLLILISPQFASSKGVFTTDITSGPDSFSASFSNVEEAFEQLDKENLERFLPSYIDTSAVNAVVDYRGIDINFSFLANSTTLTMTIPGLNISETFDGTTRDDSGDLLVEYLKGAGLDSVNRIQKELARVSATDPVAGNPASLMGTMVSNNYSLSMSMNPMSFASTPGGNELLSSVLGSRSPTKSKMAFGATSSVTTSTASGSSTTTSPSASTSTGSVSSVNEMASNSNKTTTQIPTSNEQSLLTENELTNQNSDNSSSGDTSSSTASNAPANAVSPEGIGSSFGIDISHSFLDLDGDKANTETIIIDYQYQFEDPLKVLRVKMPLAITDTEGSVTYDVDLGIAFSFPLSRSWSLTPGLSYGVGGSEDLGGGAAINGYSLLSSFRFVYGNYLYNLGNMVGHYATGSVSLGDYEIDPGISNTVYRNGLVILRPSLVFNVPTMLQLILIDTRYSGDELYTEHYYEAGFAFGLITDDDLLAEDSFNLGFTYLDSTDSNIKGYKINFGYRF